jgi:hypothetical protein
LLSREICFGLCGLKEDDEVAYPTIALHEVIFLSVLVVLLCIFHHPVWVITSPRIGSWPALSRTQYIQVCIGCSTIQYSTCPVECPYHDADNDNATPIRKPIREGGCWLKVKLPLSHLLNFALL